MVSAAARSSTSGSPPPPVGSLAMASAPQPAPTDNNKNNNNTTNTASGSANANANASASSASNATPSTSPGKGNGSDTSSPSAIPAFRQNGHKSCDACKTRKVKCPNVDYPNPCGNCVRRKEACHFGTKKVPRRNVTKHLRFTQPCTTPGAASSSTMLCYVDAPGTDGGSTGSPCLDDAAAAAARDARDGRDAADLIPSLYVDHLLAQAQAQTRGKETPFVKGNGIFGGSYSLTFFSESRLLSLSARLRNNKVNELVRRINGIVSGRLRRSTEPPGPGDAAAAAAHHHANSHRSTSASSTSSGPTLSVASVMDDAAPMPVDPQFAAACIHYYFDRVHPMYPFLDRDAFLNRALPAPGSGDKGDKALAHSLARSKAWSSLYYTVLAIGCVYSEGGGAGSSGVNTAAVASDPFLGASSASMPSSAPSSPSGSFEPGKGTAWRLFSIALGNFSDLLILPDSLLTLQALTAMVIYGLGVSCLSIERVILSEASRRAQSLASNFGTSTSGSTSSSPTFQRTFWVLYGLEKVMSFHFGRSSTFVDSDIACPFPADLGGGGDGYDAADSSDGSDAARAATGCWFLLLVRHGRLLSRTYSSLFSVGTARGTAASSLATIDRLCDEVEAWRVAIPETRGLRPECNSWRGGSSGSSTTANSNMLGASGTGSNKNSMALRSANPTERNIALALRYLYHGLVVILARAKLHHLGLLQTQMMAMGGGGAAAASSSSESGPGVWTLASARVQETEARRGLMVSARGILELTPIIDVEPYMPLWVLAVIPLTALFVLFDLVVDHPGDASADSGTRTISSDTALNLALLDMGAGYFSRIEYASNSSLPGSLISEFAHIARDYVNDYQRSDWATSMPLAPPIIHHQTHPQTHIRRDSPDDVVHHAMPMLQSTPHMLSGQQPLPPPPPPPPPPPQSMMAQAAATVLPTRQAMPGAAADHQQMSLMAASSLAGWPSSSGVPGPVTAATATSGDSLSLVDGGSVAGFTDVADSLGYGFGANPYQPGNADFSGTDVMGLFTSNHYFLSEMDGILYNGL